MLFFIGVMFPAAPCSDITRGNQNLSDNDSGQLNLAAVSPVGSMAVGGIHSGIEGTVLQVDAVSGVLQTVSATAERRWGHDMDNFHLTNTRLFK